MGKNWCGLDSGADWIREYTVLLLFVYYIYIFVYCVYFYMLGSF
jgi:hypothetical protein